MASPRYDASPSLPPALDVHRLDTEAAVRGDAESVVMVKLTDEMIAAMHNAHKAHTPVRINIQPQGGVIRVGSDSDAHVFRFAVQSLPGPPADVIAYDRVHGYRATASVHNKYQVQATDKSFAETREKAQKLIEEEKQRTTKDMTRQRRDQRPVVGKRVVGSASSLAGLHAGSSLNDPNHRISPNKLGGSSTGSNAASAPSNGLQLGAGAVRPSMSPNLKADLMRKKLKARVVHLVVTGRFASADEVVKRLRKDGLPEKEDDRSKIEALVSEVSERGANDRLALKQAFYAEVDMRWAWFTTEEKTNVRRTLQPSSAISSNFAPIRKSGMDRMQAPSSAAENKKSPRNERRKEQSESATSYSSAPTTANRPSAGGMISGGKKVSPQLARAAPLPASKDSKEVNGGRPTPKKESPPMTSCTPLDDLLPPSVPQKRKAHMPNTAEKKSRQDSASPPEDPTIQKTLSSSRDPMRTMMSGGSTGGSSVSSSSCSSSGASSRLTSPVCSLASPQQPSQDWSKYYGEAKTVLEAEKYYQQFCDEYSDYMQCFSQLNKVATEFRDLSDKLERARRTSTSHDVDRVEKEIHQRYQHYEKDAEFLRVRQRHTDLRSKLSVLKSRIGTWEERSSSGNDSSCRDSLFAM